MPHNTREVEEVIESFDFEDELVDYGLERGMARKFASLIKGTFRTTLHHQLQKARVEELNRIRHIALTMGDCPINNPAADAGWMKFMSMFVQKISHSELDQPNN